MEKSKTSNRYSPEMRARAVRLVREHQGSFEPQCNRCVSPVVSAKGHFGHAALQLSLQEFGNGAPK